MLAQEPVLETSNPDFTTPEQFNFWWSDFKQNFYPCNADAWLNNRLVVSHFKNFLKETGVLNTEHGSFIVEMHNLESRSKNLPSPKQRQKLFSDLWLHWSAEHHSMIKFYHYDFCHCLGQFENWVEYYIPELDGHPEFKKFCDELARVGA